MFVSDGHEAPPVDPKLRLHLERSSVTGVIVGVGGDDLSPIPVLDDEGKVTGYWAADQVPQVDGHSLGRPGSESSETMVDLSAGTQTVVIQVNAAGAIRGKLVGAARATDFAVALLSADAMNGERVLLAAVPDAQGGFTFESLRPGKYYVAAQPVAASKSRWISDPSRMLQIEIRGGSYTELELPAVAAKEGDRE